MADLITSLLTDGDQAREQKRDWEQLWQECGEYFAPWMADFLVQWTPGRRRDEKIIDAHGIHALGRFARHVNGFLTPEGFPWLELRVDNEAVGRVESVKRYLQMVSRVILDLFHSASSGFYTAMDETYTQLGVFATAPLFIGEQGGFPFYQAIFLNEIAMLTDDRGNPMAAYRKFKQTAFQIATQFGREGLPHSVASVMDKDQSTKFTVHHIVRPRRDGDPFSLAEFPFFSAYILEEDKEFLQRPNGYFEFPFIFPRWDKSPNEMYGRGPGIKALGDVKMLQKVVRDTARGIHKSVDPNIILADDGTVQPRINMNPGGFWYARMTPQGNFGVQQVPFAGNISHGTAFAAELRAKIDQHFFLDAFELPPFVTPDGAKNHMSATEFAGRQRQQLQLSGPLLSRQRQENLFPVIRRTYLILVRNRIIPPPPMELQRSRVIPEYVSPMAGALRNFDAGNFMQFLGHLLPLAQVDPRVLMRINPERTVDMLAASDQVPLQILNSDEEFQALVQRELDREQAALQLEQLKTTSKAGLETSKALALSN